MDNYYGFSTYEVNNSLILGYRLIAGTPNVATQDEINNNGKIYNSDNISSGLVNTGWYLTNIETYSGIGSDTRAVVSLLKVINGSGQDINIIIDDFTELGTVYACGTHNTPLC